MLYAYFGGLSADKQATYELVLEQRGPDYTLMSLFTTRSRPESALPSSTRWGWLRQTTGARTTKLLYAGTDVRRALLTLLQAACAANLAELGQRFCYVLPAVPSQAGALAALIPSQLRHDNSLPLHPQLWQIGRPLDTLPVARHIQTGSQSGVEQAAKSSSGWWERRAIG